MEFLEKHNSDLESINADLRQQVATCEASPPGNRSEQTDRRLPPSNNTSKAFPLPDPNMRQMADGFGTLGGKSPVYELCLPLFDHELLPAGHEYQKG